MAVRVAHLIYGLGLGGLEQLVVHLAARSRARGIESSIVALGDDGPMGELARRQDVDVELLPADGMSLPALMGIRRELEKRGVAVLHAHDLGPWLNGVAVRALRPKTRVMATFHEQRTPQGKKRHAAALAARATDVLVACGDKVREDILGWARPAPGCRSSRMESTPRRSRRGTPPARNWGFPKVRSQSDT